jgi:hypothetical protein
LGKIGNRTHPCPGGMEFIYSKIYLGTNRTKYPSCGGKMSGSKIAIEAEIKCPFKP